MAPAKSFAIKSPRKLIEVALPLDKINAAAAREKSIRHGHPSTLHLWWARRPLAAARAVLFAQLVNDPGFERHLNRGLNKVEAAKERERLFKIIEDLVIWENSNNEQVLSAARSEIWRSWRETCELNRNHPNAATLFNPERLPAFHDPFAGGGTIPVEAQRLGLETYASDLNPVAITINKAMIEIPPRFAGQHPVGPLATGERDPGLSRSDWPGTTGLAEDIRRYGVWMRAEAEKRIGHLYPRSEISKKMVDERPELEPFVGQSLNVIAWLWARTVKSPNPAYSHVEVPLVSTFVLSSKPGKSSYVVPIVDGDSYWFTVKQGPLPTDAEEGTKAKGRGANFSCILSGVPISGDYIKAEGRAGRMGSRLLAVVVEGTRGRFYLAPDERNEKVAESLIPHWRPSGELPAKMTGGTCVPYGLSHWADIFTSRQLIVLSTFIDLIKEAVAMCEAECKVEQSTDQEQPDQITYGKAIGVYLSFLVDKILVYSSTLCPWLNQPKNEIVGNTFGRQAFPMMWDYAEANLLGGSSGDISKQIDYLTKAVLLLPATTSGFAIQSDAATQQLSRNRIVSTDPPYFDNIAYADLSDFFYVWLRKSLGSTYPSLFSTIAVPKAEELVASAYRHGGKEAAREFFMEGMTKALANLYTEAHEAFPISLYYAFKQSDTEGDSSTSSAGWEAFIEAVLSVGFSVVGTWPMRTERPTALKFSVNALASSIVLICRKRDLAASTISRRDFLRELQSVLPDALIDMTRGGVNSPVAPVDLSQAIIGPGMGIFSKYKAVLEADGKSMSVRTALQLINRFLADDEFDGETQFCLQWLESYGWKPTDYGFADTLAQAKGAVLAQMHREGILSSGGGLVQLIRWQDLDTGWTPERQNLTPIWQALHQLIANLQAHGEQSTGAVLAGMPAVSGRVRTLAYRLYTLAERKGLAEDARPYNELIGAWSAIELAAAEVGPIETQSELF